MGIFVFASILLVFLLLLRCLKVRLINNKLWLEHSFSTHHPSPPVSLSLDLKCSSVCGVFVVFPYTESGALLYFIYFCPLLRLLRRDIERPRVQPSNRALIEIYYASFARSTPHTLRSPPADCANRRPNIYLHTSSLTVSVYVFDNSIWNEMCVCVWSLLVVIPHYIQSFDAFIDGGSISRGVYWLWCCSAFCYSTKRNALTWADSAVWCECKSTSMNV